MGPSFSRGMGVGMYFHSRVVYWGNNFLTKVFTAGLGQKEPYFFSCLYKKATKKPTTTYTINLRRRPFQAGLGMLVFWLLIKAQKIRKIKYS
jgi:hypothetical protein